MERRQEPQLLGYLWGKVEKVDARLNPLPRLCERLGARRAEYDVDAMRDSSDMVLECLDGGERYHPIPNYLYCKICGIELMHRSV